MTAGVGAGKVVTRLFHGMFVFACVVFWWLRGILFRLVGLDDAVENWALWVSFLGICTFTAGYFLPPVRFNSAFPSRLIDACEGLAYKATLWLAFPALVLAVQFFLYRGGVEYGQGEGLSILHQAVFYGHMFFAFLFLGAARSIREDQRRIIIASILVIAPRLIVSLRWGRFFLVQAVLPVLLIVLARGWVTLPRKRIFQLKGLAPFVLFIACLTRGRDFVVREGFGTVFQAGSWVRLFPNNP